MSKCALNATPNADGSCLQSAHISLISTYDDNALSIQSKCSQTSNVDECVLTTANIPSTVAGQIKREAFKAEAKRLDHEYWMNNTEIDTVMSQLRSQYPGFTHGFIHMSDLVSFPPSDKSTYTYPVYSVKELDFGKEFKYTLIKRGMLKEAMDFKPKLTTADNSPMTSFGIVCNTDTSNGSGQHWFAVYISTDQRDPNNTSKPWIRIELFNSAGGGSGNSSFDAYWNKVAMDIARETGFKCTFDIITTLQHQGLEDKYKNSGNCGSYSLFYMYSRLNGALPSEYDNPKKIITDYAMEKFRHVCFTTSKN